MGQSVFLFIIDYNKNMSRILLYDSYLKMICNSVGTRMFRNLYLKKNNKKVDVTEDGELSCAFFVSNLLLIWKMISEGHATIKSTIRDMLKNGWKEISLSDIRPGDIIVWEDKKFKKNRRHSHIGFYLGKKKAVSHSDGVKAIDVHHWTYGDKRKIIAAYRYSKFK